MRVQLNKRANSKSELDFNFKKMYNLKHNKFNICSHADRIVQSIYPKLLRNSPCAYNKSLARSPWASSVLGTTSVDFFDRAKNGIQP
jgi:hypothetical protein